MEDWGSTHKQTPHRTDLCIPKYIRTIAIQGTRFKGLLHWLFNSTEHWDFFILFILFFLLTQQEGYIFGYILTIFLKTPHFWIYAMELPLESFAIHARKLDLLPYIHILFFDVISLNLFTPIHSSEIAANCFQ